MAQTITTAQERKIKRGWSIIQKILSIEGDMHC